MKTIDFIYTVMIIFGLVFLLLGILKVFEPKDTFIIIGIVSTISGVVTLIVRTIRYL